MKYSLKDAVNAQSREHNDASIVKKHQAVLSRVSVTDAPCSGAGAKAKSRFQPVEQIIARLDDAGSMFLA
jgi:hypothetical protein